MSTNAIPQPTELQPGEPQREIPVWVRNANLLWDERLLLIRAAVVSFAIALAIAFLLPKQYESGARIMPPSSSAGSAALLAALAGRSGLGALSALTGGFGASGNTALFIDLLRSGTVGGHLVDKFDLMHVYHKRYHVDAAKYLARHTKIIDDKRSGVITLTVTDTDPVRARDIAQGYLDELNLLVNRTNTSSAHQERLFIEGRLNGVRADLEKAQQRLSDFSSTNSAIDIKEQTRAMVDSAARLQAQLIVEQSSLDSLRQIYGDENIRVRSALARIRVLQAELSKMSGSSTPAPEPTVGKDSELYPPLRQLPRLAVPYANLYREVRVQETVYELLTQQFEMARIQEAKDVPVVSVIDPPGIPEKKSFPPRLLMAVVLTGLSFAVLSVGILVRHRWRQTPDNNPVKSLLQTIASETRGTLLFLIPRTRRTT